MNKQNSPTQIAFVCVQNAGRSQMAKAFAEREKENRQMNVDIITGGTDPADHVHSEVVDVMEEEGFDLSDRTPREITSEDLEDAAYVITMGCSADGVCPADFGGESRDWNLDDPDGQDPDAVRSTRDQIRRRVRNLFDEIAR